MNSEYCTCRCSHHVILTGKQGIAGPIGATGKNGRDSIVPGPKGDTVIVYGGPPGKDSTVPGPASIIPGPMGRQGLPGKNGFGTLKNGFLMFNELKLNEEEAKANGPGTVYKDSNGFLKIV